MLAPLPCFLTPLATPCWSANPPAPGLQGNSPPKQGKRPLWPATRPSSQQWPCASVTPLRPARTQPTTSGSNCCRYRSRCCLVLSYFAEPSSSCSWFIPEHAMDWSCKVYKSDTARGSCMGCCPLSCTELQVFSLIMCLVVHRVHNPPVFCVAAVLCSPVAPDQAGRAAVGPSTPAWDPL